jgi:hypothetical protein
MLRHLDSEMAQALLLGQEIQHPSMTYPPVVGSAMRTTFCFHYRALLEFFHNGRKDLIANARDPQKNALLVRHLLPSGTELGITPTVYEKRRFLAADILTAHLSSHRIKYEKLALGWGCWKDQLALKRRIQSLISKLPNSAKLLPLTTAVLFNEVSRTM